MLRSPKDISDAVSSGRIHIQRFFKNAGVAGDTQWQDWSYASGQPAYDARIGDALAFTPTIATRNDAIYFPGIASGQERCLLNMGMYTTAGGTGQLSVDFQLYDLLGIYPLIDGDSTDAQAMDNTSTLPRYTNGVGVQAILVNHVAPVLSAGSPVTINYVDADDVSRSTTVYTTSAGLGKASFSMDSAGVSTGQLYLPMDGRGVKSITDLTFTTAPGGLWAIYLVKPIDMITWQGGLAAVTQTSFSMQDNASMEAFNLPKIEDGAWLGYFYMPNGSARTVALFGYCTFIWG